MKTNSALVNARKLSIFSIFILMSINIYAQAPDIEWQKCLGGTESEEVHSILQTSDGGYIVAGTTSSNDGDVSGNHGEYDYWIVKLNSSGEIEWQKCLGGSLGDFAHSIQQTSDGGFIVTGGTSSNDGDVSGNHPSSDYWVVKLNELGDIEWQKCLGGKYTDEAYSIQQTSDGGYIVVGVTISNDGDVSGNHYTGDYWIVKLDSLGDIEWQKCLGGTYTDEAYSITDEAYSIQQTSDGGYIVAGDTKYINGYHEMLGDGYIVKLNSLGDIEWQKCLGGSLFDDTQSIGQTSDGGYIVAGTTMSNDGDVSGNQGYTDYWVVKLNSLGDIEWQKCLGGSSFDDSQSILQTSGGGYIVAGFTWSNNGDVSGHHGGEDCWVVKLSPTVGIINTQEASENIKIYPNPANNINIELIDQKESILYVKIYNVNGVKVLEKELTQSKTNINLSEYISGLYIINITDNNNEILKSEKIIVE